MSDKRVDLANNLLEFTLPVMELIKNVRDMCYLTIKEAEDEETGGYRGDGANDPDNRPRRKHHMTNWEDIIDSINTNLHELSRYQDNKLSDGVKELLDRAKPLTDKTKKEDKKPKKPEGMPDDVYEAIMKSLEENPIGTIMKLLFLEELLKDE